MPDVVILAAGQGTRLRPLTHDRPKSMLLAGGQPLIHHLLTALSPLKPGRVVLVAGHGRDALQAYVGDGSRYGFSIHYVTQAKQLGPGHALMAAQEALSSEEFVLLPADAWYSTSIIEQLVRQKGPALLQVVDARAARHGIPILRGSELVDLVEARRDDGNPSGGAYRLHRRIFERLTECQLRLRDAVRADILLNPGWSVLAASQQEYVDLIEVEDILDVHARLMENTRRQVGGTIEAGATVTGEVRIGKGSTIRTGSIVNGPVTIGDHCDVG
ncbi:MAG: sugar phosphate nucleotidyltransferase, partial [Thermoplasmatota archaeon]